MTPKQQLFVLEYLKDLNATQAAMRAGYSKKTAHVIGPENLEKPEIKAAVAAAMNQRSERTKIDADWVLEQAARVYERCMQDVKPILTQKGEHVEGEDEDGNYGPLYSFNASGANKALELVGKHVDVKAFQETIEVKESKALSEKFRRAQQRAAS